MTKFSKIQNTLFLGPFCSNLGKNELSTKIGLRPFLASIVLISCKKLEKTNDPVLRKTIN